MTMQEKYPDFAEAAKELDRLALEGYFGNNARNLTLKRESVDRFQFYSDCLDNWISNRNQYGKTEVVKLIFTFLRLYKEAIEKGGQKAVDALMHFMTGFPENPEAESLSSFTEFMRLHREVNILTDQHKQEPFTSDSEKIRLGSALTNAYSKGVELVAKLLTTCINLLEISQDIESEELKTQNPTLFKKIQRFTELSAGQYDQIIEAIDRDIRNADAHLNLRFIPEKGVFKYKIRDGNQLKSKKLSVQEFMLDKYPRIGWVVQGFIFSGILLIICKDDQLVFRTKIQEIIGITEGA